MEATLEHTNTSLASGERAAGTTLELAFACGWHGCAATKDDLLCQVAAHLRADHPDLALEDGVLRALVARHAVSSSTRERRR